jgi:hypothetical protein
MNNVLRLLAVYLLFASVAFCQATQETANPQHQRFETNVAGSATLRLHLHDGDFRVVGSDSEKISVHVESKNVEQAKNIKIQLKRSGSAVDLTLSHVAEERTAGHDRSPQIHKPVCAHAWRDLSVQGVVGNKDLELAAGDLTIVVGSPEDYSHIDLSVKFGDISGTQFGNPKGWLGNSVRRDGNGKYRLHAHVMAGDLVLRS